MATQRWNITTGLWEPYDSPWPASIDSRLSALENGQTQNWNMLVNGSFEQWSTDSTTAGEPAGWSVFWNQGAANQTWGKSSSYRSGQWAFAVSFNSSAVVGDFRRLQSAGMPCMPGQWWEFSVWVKASVANRDTVTLTGQFGIDANTNYFDANTVNIDFAQLPVSSTGYIQVIGRLQVPVGKTVMRAVISIQETVTGTTAVIVDDASLRLVDMSPATTDLIMASGTSIKMPQGASGGYGKLWAAGGYGAGDRAFMQLLGREGDANSAYINVFGGDDLNQPGRVDISAGPGTGGVAGFAGSELSIINGIVNMLGDPQYNGVSLPRGNIAGLATTADNTATSNSATYVDITAPTPALAITITAILGRRYRIFAWGALRSSTVGVGMGVAVREGSTIIGQVYVITMGSVASRPTSYAFWVDVTPTAGAHTYKLSFNLQGGTGTVISGPSGFSIDDVGLV